MKNMIFIMMLLCVINTNASESLKKETVKLNRKIALLESKLFCLEKENKELKDELKKKNKAINVLALRLADKFSSNKTNSAQTQTTVKTKQKVNSYKIQQKRSLLIYIQQKAKELSKLKKEKQYAERKVRQAKKNYKYASQTIGRERRKEATRRAYNNLTSAKSSLQTIINNIKSAQQDYDSYITQYKSL